MNIFSSLKWFKSEKEKELEQLRVEEQKLKNQILEKELIGVDVPLGGYLTNNIIISEKPYKKAKLVNNILTIVLNDGNIITKSNATIEDFNKVREFTTEEQIIVLCTSQELKKEVESKWEETEQIFKTIESFEVLKGLEDFEVEGRSVILKGTGRTLPALLVNKFAEIVRRVGETPQDGKDNKTFQDYLNENDEYQALKRFFLWCCLNPRAEVADQLYDFLVRNSFRITKQGFFTALRNVVTVKDTGDKELVKFVSESYNKIKAVWKKSPKKYHVHKGEQGYWFMGLSNNDHQGTKDSSFVGNLEDLYLDLPNMKENRFTDAYTGTFDIRVGKVVNMPKEKCSWSTKDCAEEGLHFTADEINYVGCGDTSVLILINPMKVVGIGRSKGRCYEYLPIMTVPREESTILLHDLDFDTLALDEQYAVDELADLTNRAKEGFAVEAKKYEFNIPTISSRQINNIVASLEEMKETLTKRVVNV